MTCFCERIDKPSGYINLKNTWLAEMLVAVLEICSMELFLDSAIVLRHFQNYYFPNMH